MSFEFIKMEILEPLMNDPETVTFLLTVYPLNAGTTI